MGGKRTHESLLASSVLGLGLGPDVCAPITLIVVSPPISCKKEAKLLAHVVLLPSEEKI
jgi:hypothetical protein